MLRSSRVLRSAVAQQEAAAAAAATAAAAADPRLLALAKENTRLRELLAERAGAGASKSGYLSKYREHATSSLWAPTWENRYVVLKGGTLTYYKSEQDTQFPPRGQIPLEVRRTGEAGGWVAGWEREGGSRGRGREARAGGVSLIRLSTEVHSEYVAWLEALEQAGCMRRGDAEPSPSAGSYRGASPSASQASDSDAGTGSFRERHSGWGQEVDSSGAGADAGGDGLAPLGSGEGGHPGEGPARRSLRGYTSDHSDVTHQLRATGQRHGGGGRVRREPMPASQPVHTQTRYSLLSSERISLSDQSGLITLVFIVLAATNFRLILENMLKYGLRFNPFTFARAALTPSGNATLLLCWPAMGLCGLLAYGVERLALGLLRAEQQAAAANRKRGVAYSEARRRQQRQALLSENFVFLLNLLNTSLAVLAPAAAIHLTAAEPLPGFVLTFAATILWLKLVSYAHVNWDLRMARRKGQVRPGERGSDQLPEGLEVVLRYPENISLRNLAYFVFAPTLCYQLSYPRSRRLRLRWVLKKLVMLGGALGMMLFILEQYMEPTIDNSLRPLRQMDWLRMLERVLKLSLPTLYFWLAMFYALFDTWLNIVAELTRFGDREFYKARAQPPPTRAAPEWWNATTVGEYWRLWNMPVHKWMLRHVYFPCLRHRVPKLWAGIVVFFVSAVFHEVLVGVPLHMLRMWSFWGIMAQVPLMAATEQLKRRLHNDRIGNVVFWVSFCFLGQPLSLILYYHDWRKQHGLLP
eukprot:scaffold3.g6596.t1